MNICIRGNGAQALVAAIACLPVAESVTLEGWVPTGEDPVIELPPNALRILQALGIRNLVEPLAYFPLSDITRSSQSGYILVQRPLREFCRDRYGFAHACVGQTALIEALLSEARRLGVTFSDAPSGDADLLLSNINTRTGEPTPWHHTFCSWPRDPESRDQRFLTRYLGPDACTTQLPTSDSFWVRVVAGSATGWWQAMLDEAAQHERIALTDLPPAEHWYRGNEVHFGAATHAHLALSGFDFAAGVEDAWVLQRMLDNYDDHLPTALSEYEQYRRARARRLHRYENKARADALTLTGGKARIRNLKLAFGSRFLPEMAMAELDWLYGYDPVKGFN